MKKALYVFFIGLLLSVFTACNNDTKGTTKENNSDFATYLEENEFTTEDLERVIENADNSNLFDNNFDEVTISNMKLSMNDNESNSDIYIWQDGKKIYISSSETGFIYYLDLESFTESLPSDEEENSLIDTLDTYIKSAFED